ncbi:PA14 domain-containing protein [Hymenobacter koreensis]|uniref:OmpA family protein n=1 Tax=Hymenobacter koreensis TaxID=1084523 RepID=A0ABP8JI75_9BACT
MQIRVAILVLILMLSLPAGAQTGGLPAGTGLRADYHHGENFERYAFTRTDRAIDFDWRQASPGSSVAAEQFSVRWTGFLYAPVSGEYTFHLEVDDGMRVWLDGRKIMDEWRYQPVMMASRRVQLEGGRVYALRVDYFQGSAPTRALLAWVVPAKEPEKRLDNLFGLMTDEPVPVPIPTRYLYPTSPTPPAATAPPKPVAARPVAPAVTKPVAAKPAVTPASKPASRPAKPTARPVTTTAPRPTPTPPAAATEAAALPAIELGELAELTKGRTVELKQLYFEQGKARLLPTSQPELNRLVKALQTQPDLQLEIAGHTDNVGDAAKNLALSEQRALLVRQYLVRHGIDSVRLVARGYGGSRPVADNQDPRQRPRNRRVEVVVR